MKYKINLIFKDSYSDIKKLNSISSLGSVLYTINTSIEGHKCIPFYHGDNSFTIISIKDENWGEKLLNGEFDEELDLLSECAVQQVGDNPKSVLLNENIENFIRLSGRSLNRKEMETLGKWTTVKGRFSNISSYFKLIGEYL